MNFNQPLGVSKGRMTAALVMAVVFGLATPVVTVLEMSFLQPVTLLGGLLMVFLYGFAGRAPAWLYMIVQLAATAFLLDTPFMWMMLLAGTLPAIIIMRGIALKRPFFEQLRVGIAVCGAGVVAAVLAACLTYGGNMVGRLVEAMRGQFSQMPDEAFAPLVDAVNAALSANGLSAARSMTVETYRSQFNGILSLMEEIYSASLPGMLLNGSLLTAVLSVLWGNWLTARRGLATDESFIGLERWHMPREMALGLALMWLVSYIIAGTGYASGESIYAAAYYIVSTALALQGVAAINRYFVRRGTAAVWRRRATVALICLGLVIRLLNTPLFVVGMMSALFGSRGAFRRIPNQSNSDQSGDDDPEQ